MTDAAPSLHVFIAGSGMARAGLAESIERELHWSTAFAADGEAVDL